MASFFLAPDPVQSTFFIPGGAVPGNGAQLFIYVAGSVSTPTTVYKDNAGNTAWSNPIVLDSGGNLPSGGVVWIPAGVSIKAVWAPSNDTSPPTSPYRTIDNIAGINDTTSSNTEWIAGPTPTFVSGSQFTLVGDQTLIFTKSRRLKFTVTAGTVYGTISSVTFAAVTTVNVAFAAGALDSGLSAVSYSLIAPENPSINADYINKQASSVASIGAGTTNIWGVAGNAVHVTGTNTIFNFSSAPYVGAQRFVIFDGILSLNSSAAIAMPGNLNVTTAANDRLSVYADTATSVIAAYTRATSGAVVKKQITRQVFTSGVAQTYTRPAGVSRINIRMIGGGAGGGGATANNGTAGNNTTFDTLTAAGGSAGVANAGGQSAGGAGTNGDINITGGGGTGGTASTVANNNPSGGAGGSSAFGGGGSGGSGGQAGVAGGLNSGGGGGGGGGGSTTNSGGGGGAGAYVEKSIVSPSGTYTYTVGAAANGGAAGGTAGGNGAAGIIIVDEFYD